MKIRATIILGSFLFGFSNAGPESAGNHVTEIADEADLEDSFKVRADPEEREYFPEGRASYYTQYLSAMKEPSVKAKLPEGVERVLRFTYLRSFKDPLAVRIWKVGDVLHGRAVALKLTPDLNPSKIILDRELKLEATSLKDVDSLFGKEVFWRAWNVEEKEIVSGGLDGARWIFELHDASGYRMMNVWSPEVISKLKKEGEKLRDAEIDPEKLRDFSIYETAGNLLLKMADIMPEPEN